MKTQIILLCAFFLYSIKGFAHTETVSNTVRTAYKQNKEQTKQLKVDSLTENGGYHTLIYHYNFQNQCDTIKRYTNSNGIKNEYEMHLLKYDAQGREIEYELHRFDSYTNEWSANTKEVRTYRDDDLILSKSTLSWADSIWEIYSEESYTYNADNLLELQLYKEVDGGVLKANKKREYTYDANKNCIETTESLTYSDGESWIVSINWYNKYNDKNQLIEDGESNQYGRNKNEYTYEDNLLKSMATYYSEGSKFVSSYKYEYAYNANNFLTTEERFAYKGEENWALDQKTTYTVDNQGLVTEKITYDSWGGMLEPGMKEVYTYYEPLTPMDALLRIHNAHYAFAYDLGSFATSDLGCFIPSNIERFMYWDDWEKDDNFVNTVHYSEVTAPLAVEDIHLSGCDSLTYKDEVYTETTFFEEIIKDISDQDSLLLRVNITVNESTTTSVDMDACGSLEYKGNTYTRDTTFTETFVNANGCDSILTVNIIVHSTSTGLINMSACESLEYKGQTYTRDTALTETLVNALGCDSILTINITIHQNTTTAIDDSIYRHLLPYTKYGFNLNPKGSDTTATMVLQSIFDCDSTISLHLKVLDTIIVNNELNKNVQAMKIYPNPTRDFLYVDLANADLYQIEIYSLQGKLLLSEKNIRDGISLKNYKKGSYIFVLKNKQGLAINSRMIIKQ